MNKIKINFLITSLGKEIQKIDNSIYHEIYFRNIDNKEILNIDIDFKNVDNLNKLKSTLSIFDEFKIKELNMNFYDREESEEINDLRFNLFFKIEFKEKLI
jgi:hypothetical protein